MTRPLIGCALTLLTLTLLATPALAQEYAASPSRSAAGGGPAALTAGTWGLTLGVLGGNPHVNNSAGFSYFFTPQLNFGLSLGLRFDNGNDALANLGAGPGGGEWGLAIAPMIKYFLPRGHAVVPYIFGKLNLAFVDTNPVNNYEEYISVEPGFGAEWFPYDYFSIGGYVGLNLNLVPDLGLGLLTSGMMANFYF